MAAPCCGVQTTSTPFSNSGAHRAITHFPSINPNQIPGPSGSLHLSTCAPAASGQLQPRLRLASNKKIKIKTKKKKTPTYKRILILPGNTLQFLSSDGTELSGVCPPHVRPRDALDSCVGNVSELLSSMLEWEWLVSLLLEGDCSPGSPSLQRQVMRLLPRPGHPAWTVLCFQAG